MHILALEMASTGNQHCANCIGTLSFPVAMSLLISHSQRGVGKSELQQQAYLGSRTNRRHWRKAVHTQHAFLLCSLYCKLIVPVSFQRQLYEEELYYFSILCKNCLLICVFWRDIQKFSYVPTTIRTKNVWVRCVAAMLHCWWFETTCRWNNKLMNVICPEKPFNLQVQNVQCGALI